MRRIFLAAAVAAGGLLFAACSDQRMPLPTEPSISPDFTTQSSCPSPVVLAALTAALFAPGDLLTFARSNLNNINLKMSKGDIAGARKVVLAFIDFTVKTYYQDKLRDPNGVNNPPKTDFFVVKLIDGLLCWVRLPPSGLVLGPPNAAGLPVTTQVIGPEGGAFPATDAAGNRYAALSVPKLTVSEDRLWVITRRDDVAPQGCLTTNLEQVGLCVDFSVVPAQDLAKPVTTAICQADNNDGLQLAHQLPGGKVELLAFAADPFGLCPHFSSPAPQGLGSIGRAVWRVGSFLARVVGPPPAYAGHSGLGGLVGPRLSNITAVRVRLGFVEQPANTATNSPITPPVQVAFLKVGTRAIELDTFVTNQIRVGIGAGSPEGGALAGTTTRTPAGGIATFPGLSINRAGAGYTLVADAISSPFTGSTPISIPTPSASFDVGSPDLVISSGAPTVTPNVVAPGGTVALSTWTIKNQGSGVVPSGKVLNVQYMLSTDATITNSDAFLGSTFVTREGMASGQEITGPAVAFTIPAATAPGNYWIGILADQSNEVTESNEANNFVSSPLTITAPATNTINFEVYPNGEAACSRCSVTTEFLDRGVEFAYETFDEVLTGATLGDGNGVAYGDLSDPANHFVTSALTGEGQGITGHLTMTLRAPYPRTVRFDWKVPLEGVAVPINVFDATGTLVPDGQITRTVIGSSPWRRVEVSSDAGIQRVVFVMTAYIQQVDNVVLSP